MSALQLPGWDEIVSDSSQAPRLPWCDSKEGAESREEESKRDTKP